MDYGWGRDLRNIECSERKHRDRGAGELYGEGPCFAGHQSEARPDGGLFRELHGAGIRAADHQLLGESFVGESGWQFDDYGECGESAEPPPEL